MFPSSNHFLNRCGLIDAAALASQLLDQRIALFPKLLSLSGRLDLALSQVSSLHEEQHDALLPRSVYDEDIDEDQAEDEEFGDEDDEDDDDDEDEEEDEEDEDEDDE